MALADAPDAVVNPPGAVFRLIKPVASIARSGSAVFFAHSWPSPATVLRFGWGRDD